jgi:DUF2891 family protein
MGTTALGGAPPSVRAGARDVREQQDQDFRPAVVSDASDGQIAHLHGLNLSRAWCMCRIAEALPPSDERIARLEAAVADHVDASLGSVVGGDYAVEHWLAAYAVLLLTSTTI